MIKPIVRDVMFLRQKSEPAGPEDMSIAQDLQDTLNAHRERCAGMAANMIGYRKRMIIVSTGMMGMVMVNPVILKKSGSYETEEGCLSLTGVRKTSRYRNITLQFQDLRMNTHVREFSGMIAQIIQHECDHLEGIII